MANIGAALATALTAASRGVAGYGRGRIIGREMEREDERRQRQADYEAMRLAVLEQQLNRRSQPDENAEAIRRYLTEHEPELAELGSAGLQEHFQRTRPQRPTQPSASEARIQRNEAFERMVREAEGVALQLAQANVNPTNQGIYWTLKVRYPKLPEGILQGIAADAILRVQGRQPATGGPVDQEALRAKLGLPPQAPVQR